MLDAQESDFSSRGLHSLSGKEKHEKQNEHVELHKHFQSTCTIKLRGASTINKEIFQKLRFCGYGRRIGNRRLGENNNE